MISNLDEIKARLDAQEVLQLIGYSKSAPFLSGGELRDYCPVHEGDSQRSLAINVNTNEFCCHSCGTKGGDLISLYQQARKIDFLTAIKDLTSHFGLHVENENSRSYETHHSSSDADKGKSEDDKLWRSRSVAAEKWLSATENGSHPYFERKNIDPLPGVRYGKDERGNPSIIVPFRDALEGAIQSVQFISDRGKYFATDTSPKGAFFILGTLAGATIAYLAEGIATSASIWLSQGKVIPVVSCGSCYNIIHVVEALKKAYPNLEMILCLDANPAADKEAKKVGISLKYQRASKKIS